MKKIGRNRILVLLCAVMLIFSVSACSSQTPQPAAPAQPEPAPGAPPAEPVQMGIATATIGGAYYPMGQAVANVVNAHYSAVQLTAEVTNGALENNRLLDAGESALALTNADLAFFAVNGQAPYDKAMNVAAVGNLHPSVFHIITLGDSNIDGIEDFKGKKIAVGPAGGATIGLLENVLAEYGMTMDDVKPSYLPYTDGFTQLSDGNVDIALAVSGYPAAAVMEVSATKKIKFIQPGDTEFSNMITKFPYYSITTVPKDIYKLDADAKAVGIKNVLVCDKDVDDDTIYNIAKALYDNLDELIANNQVAAQIDTSSLEDTSIPLHPGAKKYFDEK